MPITTGKKLSFQEQLLANVLPLFSVQTTVSSEASDKHDEINPNKTLSELSVGARENWQKFALAQAFAKWYYLKHKLTSYDTLSESIQRHTLQTYIRALKGNAAPWNNFMRSTEYENYKKTIDLWQEGEKYLAHLNAVKNKMPPENPSWKPDKTLKRKKALQKLDEKIAAIKQLQDILRAESKESCEQRLEQYKEKLDSPAIKKTIGDHRSGHLFLKRAGYILLGIVSLGSVPLACCLFGKTPRIFRSRGGEFVKAAESTTKNINIAPRTPVLV